MEIIIGIIIVVAVGAGFYLSRRPKPEAGSAAAPYKVESQITDAVTQEAPVAPTPVVEEAPAKKPRAKKATAAKATAAKKPRAKKTTTK